MGNNISRKSKLAKRVESAVVEQVNAVVVIELAATYTRHTIHGTAEGSERQIVYTSEKHPYCYELNKDGTIKSFGHHTLAELKTKYDNENDRLFYFNNINEGLKQGLLDIGEINVFSGDISQNLFDFHKSEVNLFISKTFPKESQTRDICWVIVLPAGTNVHDRAVIKQAANNAGLNNDICRCVFPTDVLALNEAQKASRNKADPAFDRNILQTTFFYLDNGFIENCSYDIFHDGTICNNSRNTTKIDGGSIWEWIKQFLCEIFSDELIDRYSKNHIYHFHQLCKDFEEQFGQYDIANGDISLQSKHLVTEHTYHSFESIETLIADSKYRDSVTYNAVTSSLVLSRQVLQQILEDYVAICRSNIPKTQVNLMCYITANQSPFFQESLQQELQNNNSGLLGSLSFDKGKSLISDYSFGFVAIDDFNKELHSDQNKICIYPDNTGEECAIWVFKTLIQKGEMVNVSNKYIWSEPVTFISRRKKKSNHQTLLMRSTSDKPQFINEKGFEVATTIQVLPPTEGWTDEVEFLYTLTFIEKGPIIQVADLKSGRKHQNVFTFKRNVEFLKYPTSDAMENPILAGLQSDSIKRRATYTYGIRTDPLFKEGVHPVQYKYFLEGDIRCKAVFHKLIQKGQMLNHRKVIPGQKGFLWRRQLFAYMYRSPLDNPKYIEDPSDQCEPVPYDEAEYFLDEWLDYPAVLDFQLVVGDTALESKLSDMANGKLVQKQTFHF